MNDTKINFQKEFNEVKSGSHPKNIHRKTFTENQGFRWVN